MRDQYKRFYMGSIFLLAAASAYPIYMGVITLLKYIENGFIDVSEYQKYIIPYTPLCISILVTAAALPILMKFFKKRILFVSSIIGILVFIATELGFEQIKIVEGYRALPLESWQYSLCVSTPEVLKSIGEPIYAQNNPAFKLHFYIIALVILLAVINLLTGYLKMFSEKVYDKKKPLLVQLISAVLFIGLCIFACFTAFFRNGTLNISPLSSLLMSSFFIIFGITFGVYFGCLFYKRGKILSTLVPSLMALLTTLVMYIGELILMGGVLYKFGKGIFFEPFLGTPFSIIDFSIIFVSGLITYLIMLLINKN